MSDERGSARYDDLHLRVMVDRMAREGRHQSEILAAVRNVGAGDAGRRRPGRNRLWRRERRR